MFCKTLPPSVSAQDPTLELARIIEGILPLWMNRGSLCVAGEAWAKHFYDHPWGLFGEWWECLEQRYDADNAKAKCFWAEFSRDAENQAKILAYRSLHREMKRILDTDCHYATAMGLLEPKPEPVDEVPDAKHFAFRYVLSE